MPPAPATLDEAEIAAYLARTPGFFERHAELLAGIRLTSPHGQRAVTLSERQMEMLRERIKGLELKIVEMIRAGQENMAHVERLHRFARTLMRTADPVALPAAVVATLKHEFLIPQAAVRLWSLAPAHASAEAAGDFARSVSEDVKTFTASLSLPYCGVNAGFEAVGWLDDAATVASVAMIPLRQGDAAFGLLVLGSPDPTRYSAEMGTEFLMRIGELAGTALSRLRASAR